MPSGRIAICTVEGDYIEWTKETPPEAGDCPFVCGCTPVVYVPVSEVEQLEIDLGLAEDHIQYGDNS